MKKVILLLGLITVVCALVAGCGGQTSRVGYVDLGRVIKEAPKVSQLNADLEAKMKDLNAKGKELQANQNKMSPEEYQKKLMELRQESQSIQMGVSSQFDNMIQPVFVQVTEEKNLSALLKKNSEEGQPIVVEGGIDVTDDIIQKLK